jgi:hypothetical protein
MDATRVIEDEPTNCQGFRKIVVSSIVNNGKCGVCLRVDVMSEAIQKCASPVCQVRFEPSGLDIKPKRYCCDGCRMDVWAIKRASKLLERFTADETLRILRGAK